MEQNVSFIPREFQTFEHEPSSAGLRINPNGNMLTHLFLQNRSFCNGSKKKNPWCMFIWLLQVSALAVACLLLYVARPCGFCQSQICSFGSFAWGSLMKPTDLMYINVFWLVSEWVYDVIFCSQFWSKTLQKQDLLRVEFASFCFNCRAAAAHTSSSIQVVLTVFAVLNATWTCRMGIGAKAAS